MYLSLHCLPTDKFRDGARVGAEFAQRRCALAVSVEAFRYPINMEGRGEEYKYVVLFDLATVDLLTAPEP